MTQKTAAKKTGASAEPKPAKATGSIVKEPEANGEYPFPANTYWHVVFGGKARRHDSERVFIGGPNRKHYAREVETIAPGEHLNMAYDAREPQFTLVPGQDEKQLAPLWLKAFRVLKHKGKNGQATAEEYQDMLKTGTVTYEAHARHRPSSST